MLQNAAKFQPYSFSHFWIIKEIQAGGWFFPFHTQIRVKTEKVYKLLSELTNVNRAFHQLVKKWLLWGSVFMKKNY